MRSVTEQAALDEFLSTAELAGTDFTAEKMNNIKIIQTDQRNPYLLSATEERSAVKKQAERRNRLTVPRRPAWDESTTPQQLDKLERASLLDWRRGLAELQDTEDLLMTPFERNIEVWRQLWRVIERSDLVVQIVDARNPLLFRSEDLEKYVKEVDPKKNNLLLVNKADMMTLSQREAWADYFENAGINYKFFSASLAKALNEAMDSNELNEGASQAEREGAEDGAGETIGKDMLDDMGHKLAEDVEKIGLQEKEEDGEKWDSVGYLEDDSDQRTRILTVDALEALFLQNAPKIENADPEHPRKIQIGLVGYPNVGKSSTINALIGAKKVSVSSTPGKTKHFQTIHLSPEVILCDCPGLVFPNFATTKAELVCNGILPIDQLREFTGPAGLVAQRVPQAFLEALYGIKIEKRPLEEGGTGIPTAEELLIAYATARGFTKTGQGQPDESRAARYILKDYVNGKLLFCHPPPPPPTSRATTTTTTSIDPYHFNRELYDIDHLPQKRQAFFATAAEQEGDEEEKEEEKKAVSSSKAGRVASVEDDLDLAAAATTPVQGAKSTRLDKKFFAPGQGINGAHFTMPFNHAYSEQGAAAAAVAARQQQKELSGRKARVMVALERDVDVSDVRLGNGKKKHYKGGRKKVKGVVGEEV